MILIFSSAAIHRETEFQFLKMRIELRSFVSLANLLIYPP